MQTTPDSSLAEMPLRPRSRMDFISIEEHPRLRLYVYSALLLFLELALIRWLGENVLYLSYFSNFILLASFLGIGVGFIRPAAFRSLRRFLPVMLLAVIAAVRWFGVSVHPPQGTGLILVGSVVRGAPSWIVLPTLFIACALIMAVVASGAAEIFGTLPALEAYRADIAGSLTGIVVFSLLALVWAPPLVWGIVVTLLLALLYGKQLGILGVVCMAAILVVLGAQTFTPTSKWSPYYKIDVARQGTSHPATYLISANGMPHQMMESIHVPGEWGGQAYSAAYRFDKREHGDVLIIGSGNGKDVARALDHGAKHVDAVEIDPRIAQLGRELNPDRPYQDPRVSLYVNDGRAFLEHTPRMYDLILLAKTDSLTLISGQSALRLESYLFTLDSVRSVASHLKPGGTFSTYNFYWQPWLVDRIAETEKSVFHSTPCLEVEDQAGTVAATVVSRSKLVCPTHWTPKSSPLPSLVTDDHPFAYLRTPSIPPLYLVTLALVLLFALGATRWASGGFRSLYPYKDLFLMGASFLLLETKSVVQFALLFGTTWFVNALVFAGILTAILAAVEVARRWKPKRWGLMYAALFASLVLAWLVPTHSILALAFWPRFIAAVLLAFTPIFLANLVFAERFSTVANPPAAFGANLLGAMVGGIAEYAALIVGYHALLVFVAVIYGLAFVAAPRKAAVS